MSAARELGRGPSLGRLIVPGLTALVMLVVLLGLGTWQVERLHWKQGILAQLDQAERQPPQPLGPDPRPWTKVAVSGELRNNLSALYGADVRDTRTGPTLGGDLIVPLIRPGQPPILIDRGWVPGARGHQLDQPTGPITVIGYVHPADSAGLFSATDDVVGREFFTLDPAAIGRALGLAQVAPFTIVALGPMPAAGSSETWPIPAQHLPQPPNNHLSYAITWYGLAAALVVVFSLWVRKTGRS